MLRLKAQLENAPTAELVSLDEARLHVRRDDSDDDAKITALIAVAMSRLDGIDGILGRALITQTWSEQLDRFPVGDRLELPLAPAQSIGSIEYYDFDNAPQTLAASNYSLHTRAFGSYVKLGAQSSWPSTYDRDDAVTVTFTAGYGDAAADVPAAIKHAALLLIGDWYENREDSLIGNNASAAAFPLPNGVMSLLRPYIRPHF